MPDTESFEADNGAHARLWGDLLNGIYVAWKLVQHDLGRYSIETSPARQHDHEIFTKYPHWGNREATNVGIDAVQAVDAAAQYIRGLNALIADQVLVVAHRPLVRGVVEHVSHAGWLLDPSASTESRVARFWMARLSSLRRYKHMTKSRNASRPQQKLLDGPIESTEKELLRRFPGVDLSWSDMERPPQWVIVGESYPSLRKQWKLLARWIGIEGKVGGIYDILSFVSHPNPAALSEIVDTTKVGDRIEYGYRINSQEWRNDLALACSLVYRIGQAVCSYFGLDDGPLEQWMMEYEDACGPGSVIAETP
ncbi:hypothetical protein [Saccharopolyspora sp. 5N708]|uniref:hypothetical protein n=1 Tax=Saccharopolyspora sp. 5N708 TaxID=3457424 RepID=UPI003FD64B58